MAVSQTSGKTYDVAEFGRLEDFFKEQEAEFRKTDLDKNVQNKKLLQYVLILTGAVVSLYTFSVLVNKKR